MKKIIVLVTTLLVVFLNILPSFADTLDINVPSYILVDPKNGQVLFEHDSTVQWYPASTTKIMTAILAIEAGNLDRIVTANTSNIDPGNGGANIGIMNGEELSIRLLLNALLIKSANESANIIADNISPTRQDFVDLMNKRALELGCTNTHFITTNGMHDKDHYTTARDMAKIACHAMTLKDFRDIVSQKSYIMPETNKHNIESSNNWGTLYSTNKLFYYTSDYFSEVLGIKTGYTAQAGNNLVSSVRDSKGMELLAVVFGVRNSNVDKNIFGSSRTLFEYGFKNFLNQKIISKNELVKNVSVLDAKDNVSLDLIIDNDLYSILPKNINDWNLVKDTKLYSTTYTAPISQGTVLGVTEFRRNGTLLGSVNILAAQSVEKSVKAIVKEKTVKFFDIKIIRVISVSVIILLAFFCLRIILRRASSRGNSRKQED
jgi:serine-type D-Ala-D-Ala carboxypeptidase (penicillin-binding protein 5/6)